MKKILNISEDIIGQKINNVRIMADCSANEAFCYFYTDSGTYKWQVFEGFDFQFLLDNFIGNFIQSLSWDKLGRVSVIKVGNCEQKN